MLVDEDSDRILFNHQLVCYMLVEAVRSQVLILFALSMGSDIV